jgi:hypothetical protein
VFNGDEGLGVVAVGLAHVFLGGANEDESFAQEPGHRRIGVGRKSGRGFYGYSKN